jgi:prepilin-type N-terminal cleavage/methylation domain-containing protein
MSRSARRAFTLIEMITVIAVGAALTGIAVSLLLVLYRADRNGRAHAAAAQSLQQLAEQFRRDVHAATDVTANEKTPQQWQIDMPGGVVVRYALAADGVAREEKAGEKVVRHESYRLSGDSTVLVMADRAASPPVATLTVEPKEVTERPGKTFRIEAVLGRDLRFAGQRKEEK